MSYPPRRSRPVGCCSTRSPSRSVRLRAHPLARRLSGAVGGLHDPRLVDEPAATARAGDRLRAARAVLRHADAARRRLAVAAAEWRTYSVRARAPHLRGRARVLTLAEPELRPPQRWFVLDEPNLNAAAYANTLMVTRGLLESGYLEPVLAHELGHLNSSDSRLTAALHRLTTPPRRRMRFPLAGVGFSSAGARGVAHPHPVGGLLALPRVQRRPVCREARPGPSAPRFLDTNALENDLPMPFMWLTEHSHPSTEHRIDRIYQHETHS